MGLKSRPTRDDTRQELRWRGLGPGYAVWTETVAGRWQHAVRCATCRGLIPASVDGEYRPERFRRRPPGSHESADSACRLP
jgi:hypothetical protein